MEARLLASVLQSDTHKRLAAADEISDYLKREEGALDDFAEIDHFIAGLASWMGSSNFKVSGERELVSCRPCLEAGHGKSLHGGNRRADHGRCVLVAVVGASVRRDWDNFKWLRLLT